MVVDRELGRSGRVAPRWLDQPRREAFLVSVGKLTPEEESIPWPSWLSPSHAEARPSAARSSARRSVHSKSSHRRTPDDDTRPPPGIPAPTGA